MHPHHRVGGNINEAKNVFGYLFKKDKLPGASVMPQQAKELTANPDGRSSIPGAHMRKENTNSYKLPFGLHIHTAESMCLYM